MELVNVDTAACTDTAYRHAQTQNSASVMLLTEAFSGLYSFFFTIIVVRYGFWPKYVDCIK